MPSNTIHIKAADNASPSVGAGRCLMVAACGCCWELLTTVSCTIGGFYEFSSQITFKNFDLSNFGEVRVSH